MKPFMEKQVCIPHLGRITGIRATQFFDPDSGCKTLIRLDKPLFTTDGIMIDYLTTSERHLEELD